MVFVSVGTQKQQFLRIFNMVENSEVLKDDEIVAQTGNTKFSSKKIKSGIFIKIIARPIGTLKM